MRIGIIKIELRIPGVQSLKEKRGQLKPMLAQMRRRFNVSAAEVDFQDQWQKALVAVACVSNDVGHIEQSFQQIIAWLEQDWRSLEIVREEIEIIQ